MLKFLKYFDILRNTKTSNKAKFSFVQDYFRKATFFIFLFWVQGQASASEITITNLSLEEWDELNNTINIQFDISWKHSWRTDVGPKNWDAAWVFAKYRKKNETDWNHVKFKYVDGTGTGDGHTPPANCTIKGADDDGGGNSLGVFIYNSQTLFMGDANYQQVKLLWNYTANGLTKVDSVEVWVMGIEMVYVPQGAFSLGNGGINAAQYFYERPDKNVPFQISNENEIQVGTTNGQLYFEGTTSLNNDDRSGPIPGDFPKGFNAFYCMKYEVSQEQYIIFLNKLDNTQSANLYYPLPAPSVRYRYAISATAGSRTTTSPFVACNFLSWPDIAAYLDWAALRPMTELEFEKACRGTEPSLTGEYAWGSNNINTTTFTLNDEDAENEEIDPTLLSSTEGSALYNTTLGSIGGPVRCGIFASDVTHRQEAGATFYGIMEMSGNLRELIISVGKPEGRAYDGTHGDGVLATDGHSNVANWPPITGANKDSGTGYRGGGFDDPNSRLRVADRFHATSGTGGGRAKEFGGRGVRTAP